MRKWPVGPRRGMADAIVHYGGSVGTWTTFANAGAELRFGRQPLPDDFGTAPTLAQGVNTAPTRSSGGLRRLRVHGFLAFDARYVVRDITLDGNISRDSPSVESEPYVAEVAIGFATYWRGWKITAGRYFRTKEFETEARNTTYGRVAFQREVGTR
jgi:lipid A 3-O-deacylase